MPKIMKSMNIISRCQSIYRTRKIDSELCGCHHSLVFAICRKPGSSQEELARDVCLNKSSVTRALVQLEERGYVTRTPNPTDKRQTLVQPTDKMLNILPEVQAVSIEWSDLISEGIPEEELQIFQSVLRRMELRARELVQKMEDER